MVAIRRSLRGFTADARSAFRQAPLEVALGLFTAGLFSYAIALEGGFDAWGRVIIFAGLALPLGFGCTLLHAFGRFGRRGRWAWAAAGATAAALYAFVAFDPDRQSEMWRAVLLLAGVVLLLSLVPVLGARDRSGRRDWFWLFNARLASRVATVAAYALVLYLGLAAALGSVSALFDLEVRGVAYAHLFGWVAFALVPWIVVGGVPALVRPPEPVAGAARRFIRGLDTYLLAPLLLTYAAILYAYVIRIAVIGEVPKNVLSPLVLGAGMLWLLANFLLEPLRDDPGSAGLSRLVRSYPLALLPMIALGVWAVAVRVAQYGWTEFRYIRLAAFVALGVLAAAAVVRFARKRPPPLIGVSAVFAAVLLLGAVGPWGALATSKRSQQARLEAAVERAREVGGAQGGTAGIPAVRVSPPAGRTRVPYELYDEINATASYLVTHFGADALGDLAPPPRARDEWSALRLADALGFVAGGRGPVVRLIEAGLPETSAVPGVMGGTGYFVRFGPEHRPFRRSFGCRDVRAPAVDRRRLPGMLGTDPVMQRLDGLALVLDPLAGRLRVQPASAGTTLVAELAPLVQRIGVLTAAACEAATRLTPEQARVTLRDGSGRTAGQLIVTGIQIAAEPAPSDPGAAAATRFRITSLDGFLILPP